MPAKYLLYVDLLGFSELVIQRGAISKLYDVVNALSAHKHPGFRTIAFSDTLLVYNTDNPTTAFDRRYMIMFMCEFAQDLFYRLVGKDTYFRAYLTTGEFKVRQMENMQGFYGGALVEAYQREKEIQCTGLFIDNELLDDCDVYHCELYDENSHFVHLMQSLDVIRFPGASPPIPAEIILAASQEWFLAYDFTYLRNVHRHMSDYKLHPRIRMKHLASWQMIRKRHKELLDTLEASCFDPRSVSDFDWSEPMRRVGTANGAYG